MGAIIETFHIDLRLLIAQAINFAIVFFVLYYFALKPLLKVMQERTQKIAKSIDTAKKIEEKMQKTEKEYNNQMAKAKKEAAQIIEKAGEVGEKKKIEVIARAKEEIGQIINQEKIKMQAEKAQTLREIKKETADLVIATVGKILEEKIDVKKDKEIIKKLIS